MGRVLPAALRATVPVLLGYLTIGIAFGLLLSRSGLAWWLAPLMSVIVYAGAAQFMALGLLGAGTDIVQIAILTLVINARHMVYGLSLLERFARTGRRRPYLIYALTDETYGILTTVSPPEAATEGEKADFYAAVTALDQAYWVAGSTLGALAGGLIRVDTRGLDFALTALFVVLLVEQMKTVRRPLPYLIAAASTLLAFLAAGPERLLLFAIGLSILGLLVFRRKLA